MSPGRARWVVLSLIASILSAAAPSSAAVSNAPPRPSQGLPAGVATDWWTAVQRDLARSEYMLSPVTTATAPAFAARYQAPNRAQGFQTRFADTGIRVAPRATRADETPAWEWGWSLSSWGRKGSLRPPASEPRLHADVNRIEYRRGALVEWYVNDALGLEQGFTIDREPGAKRTAEPLRLEMAMSGNVAAKLADDRRGIDFLAPGGALAIRLDHLQAVDAGGRALPAWFEVGGDRVAIVVDDRGATYPITIDPLATSPAWTAEGDQAGASFGYAVAPAGDVNADGYDDVIVGAPFYDNGQMDEGRAFVFHGSAAGLSLTPNWSAEGDQVSALFGYAVSTAGDVNGDGFSDVIVGAYQYDNGETNEGRAYIYHGSAGGLSLTPNRTLESNQAGALFGIAVGTAGDVNDDGFADVLIGAYGFDNGQTDEGRAFLYRGSASGVLSTPSWTAEGDQESAFFGFPVTTAGDVNGDGFSDVIIGSFGYDNGQPDEGRAFVYMGSSGGLASVTAWTAESDQDTAWFGGSVATAGDVNGDGYSDVIVGARYYDHGQHDEGRAYVFLGSNTGLSTLPAWIAESDQDDAWFGAGVATAGDVNGDGYADVIVGARFYDNGQQDEGRAYVYFGSSNGLANSPSWTAESDQVGAEFGYPVATAGDVNGDGISDVIVGAGAFESEVGQSGEGRASVFYGAAGGLSSSPVTTLGNTQALSYFGSNVAPAGDVNGDGFDDVIVSAYLYDDPGMDEGKVFVYYGSATGLDTLPGWTAAGDQDTAFFGVSAAAAGDVNGDGYGDVIVGAFLYDHPEIREGRAFVYHGSLAGLSATPDWTAESDQTGARFGNSVAGAGDVNGDGFSDVIVGAPLYDHGQVDEGAAFIYYGSASGLSVAPSWTAESDASNARFGMSVSTAGDVNGDGFSDVIVGAYQWTNGQASEGRAFVYHGRYGGPNTVADWTAESNQAGAQFGSSVATAGDVNGDGFSDVIVGAPFYDNGETDEGAAFVYHGSAGGLSVAPSWSAESNQSDPSHLSPQFGGSVATAGDVNGDGYSDVIVGALFYDNGQIDEGAAFVYHGSATGLSLVPNWTAEIDQVNAGFGDCVARAGDVNGDGFDDVIVGAYAFDNAVVNANEGRAFVHYGNGGACRVTRPRQMISTANMETAPPIAPLGRSDSPTEFNVVSTSYSFSGRAWFKREIEVKPLGTPFDGLNTIISTSFAQTFTNAEWRLVRTISGLDPNTLYHWRVRVRYRLTGTPFQHCGRWVHMPTNGWNEADLRTAGAPLSVVPAIPTSFELRPAGANPGLGRSQVSLALTRRATVRAEVLDVAGRVVAVLVGGRAFEAGSHVLTWDGRDRSGAAAPAGMYFVRARAGAETGVCKIVLSR